jgi:hypothetical protein
MSDYGIYLGSDGDACTLFISYSDIRNGQQGIGGAGNINLLQGNINDDPLFTGWGEHPYALSTGSPCIDAGNPDTTGLFMPPGDLLGNLRVWDGDGDGNAIVDMGAYEFGAEPVGLSEPAINGQLTVVNVYPNPTAGVSNLQFTVYNSQSVLIKIYDLHGREVANALDEKLPAGEHLVRFDAYDLPAGIYYYRAQEGNQIISGKIILIK